ncbi:MAG: Sua5/YciO/YrdC/YwlC family protein [Planctomycetota bacterium]
MSDPQRFDLQAGHAEAALEVASAALDRGELVVVPTETVYGIAAREDRPAAVERLDTLKTLRRDPYSRAVDRVDRLADRLLPLSLPARRVAERWWPGPITQVLVQRDGELLGVRVPGHPWTRDLIAAAGAPLLLPSANQPGLPAPASVDELAAEVVDAATVIVDGGRAALGQASTVVEPRPYALRLLREGVVSRADLVAHAVPRILITCSGNSCRSPMAEHLLRAALSARADGPDWLLPSLQSAGTHALSGQCASDHAVTALGELGLDLSEHSSRALTPELVQSVDLVLCMGAGHARAVAMLGLPEPPPVELFDPAGSEVEDPFGGPLEQYRHVAARLRRMADERAAAMLERVCS